MILCLAHNTVAVVDSHASVSAVISGTALYSCIATHQHQPASIYHRLSDHRAPIMRYHITHGNVYRLAEKMQSRYDLALALIGVAE